MPNPALIDQDEMIYSAFYSNFNDNKDYKIHEAALTGNIEEINRLYQENKNKTPTKDMINLEMESW